MNIIMIIMTEMIIENTISMVEKLYIYMCIYNNIDTLTSSNHNPAHRSRTDWKDENLLWILRKAKFF